MLIFKPSKAVYIISFVFLATIFVAGSLRDVNVLNVIFPIIIFGSVVKELMKNRISKMIVDKQNGIFALEVSHYFSKSTHKFSLRELKFSFYTAPGLRGKDYKCDITDGTNHYKVHIGLRCGWTKDQFDATVEKIINLRDSGLN